MKTEIRAKMEEDISKVHQLMDHKYPGSHYRITRGWDTRYFLSWYFKIE